MDNCKDEKDSMNEYLIMLHPRFPSVHFKMFNLFWRAIKEMHLF